MLRVQTKDYIGGLNDAQLVEYVLTGPRMYTSEAIEFARKELDRRKLPSGQIAEMRAPIAAKLAIYDSRTPPDPSRVRDSNPIVCQKCGVEAATRYVKYQQEIGAVVVRHSKSYAGHFCKTCNNKAFWKTTSITLLFGWWGLHSFFVTIAFLIGNVVTYLKTLSLAPVPLYAARPLYNDAVVAKVSPYGNLIAERLTEGMDAADVAREIAPIAGVKPGEAWALIVAMREQSVASMLGELPPNQSLR